MKTKRKNPPIDGYESQFDELDKRTRLSKTLKRDFKQLVEEMGGRQNLTVARRLIGERFVFLAAHLRQLEKSIIAESDSRKVAKMVARHVQALNSFQGLARFLGLNRANGAKPKLSVYLASKKRRA